MEGPTEGRTEGRTAIVNIGRIVSGKLSEPILAGDAILVQDGRILETGFERDLDLGGVTRIFDVQGNAVAPGLIDGHVHPAVGDWQPRLKIFDWLEAMLQAGTTSAVSQGVVHLPGRPRDPVGTKCMAILSAKLMASFRPGGGFKGWFGTVVLEPGLREEDFAEMSRHGVGLVAEIGAGSGIHKPGDVAPMVAWARKHDMKVCIHFGGAAAPGSHTIGAGETLAIAPDIICHLNGGSTAAPWRDIVQVVEETRSPLELVYNGNPRRLREIVELLGSRGELDRVFLGSDQPVGIGFSPAAILKTVVMISSVCGIPAERALALGTGNTAAAFGLEEGRIEPGRPADLIALDRPLGTQAADALGSIEVGDVPAVGMIMVDGKLTATRGKNTPQPTKPLLIRAGGG